MTVPFAWRARLAHDGALLSTLTRLFVDTVTKRYQSRIGGDGAKTDDAKTDEREDRRREDRRDHRRAAQVV